MIYYILTTKDGVEIYAYPKNQKGKAYAMLKLWEEKKGYKIKIKLKRK